MHMLHLHVTLHYNWSLGAIAQIPVPGPLIYMCLCEFQNVRQLAPWIIRPRQLAPDLQTR